MHWNFFNQSFKEFHSSTLRLLNNMMDIWIISGDVMWRIFDRTRPNSFMLYLWENVSSHILSELNKIFSMVNWSIRWTDLTSSIKGWLTPIIPIRSQNLGICSRFGRYENRFYTHDNWIKTFTFYLSESKTLVYFIT